MSDILYFTLYYLIFMIIFNTFYAVIFIFTFSLGYKIKDMLYNNIGIIDILLAPFYGITFKLAKYFDEKFNWWVKRLMIILLILTYLVVLFILLLF